MEVPEKQFGECENSDEDTVSTEIWVEFRPSEYESE